MRTYVLTAVVVALLPTAAVAADNGPVFQGENPILFKDLTNPEAHGYKPDKFTESYRILYGDQADEKIAAMKARRLMLLGRKPQHKTRDFTKVPPHLKGYEEFYAKDPRAAARKWFANAKYEPTPRPTGF